mgnify:CR=1 FL=1
MAQVGQFGTYYAQLVGRFYTALEWHYNEIKDKKGHDREIEILSKLLDGVLADQISHDVSLQHLEGYKRNLMPQLHASVQVLGLYVLCGSIQFLF